MTKPGFEATVDQKIFTKVSRNRDLGRDRDPYNGHFEEQPPILATALISVAFL